MHGDELRSVGEGRLDLDFGDHFRHAVHHLGASEQPRALTHQLGDRAPVTRAFHDRGAQVGDRLRIVELESTRQTALRQQRRGENEQLVLLAWGEFHGL